MFDYWDKFPLVFLNFCRNIIWKCRDILHFYALAILFPFLLVFFLIFFNFLKNINLCEDSIISHLIELLSVKYARKMVLKIDEFWSHHKSSLEFEYAFEGCSICG